MRWLMSLLATPLYFVCYFLFRNRLYKQSRSKHVWVMKLFRFCADNGSRRALSVYGHLLHFRGEGVENRIQGAIYLKRAAEKGDVKAQYQMGRIYEAGFETYFAPNETKAFSFYQQAASQGHSLATRRLVAAFEQGELGQAANGEQAAVWAEKLPALPV